MADLMKARNQRIAKTQAKREYPFARLKQMGGKVIQSIGLARAKVGITLKAMTYNLFRLARLKHLGVVLA